MPSESWCFIKKLKYVNASKDETWKLLAERETCYIREEKEQNHSIWLILSTNTRCCSALILQLVIESTSMFVHKVNTVVQHVKSASAREELKIGFDSLSAITELELFQLHFKNNNSLAC